MSVRLVSLAACMQTFNLTPAISRVRHTAMRTQSRPDGSSAQVEARHTLPGSITLMAKGTRGPKGEQLDRTEELPDEVENCPEVVAALDAVPALIRIERVPVKKQEASAAPPEKKKTDITEEPAKARRMS